MNTYASAFLAASSPGADSSSDPIVSLIATFLPIVLFLGLMVFLFKGWKRPLDDYLASMQRVEKLLERIAVALERKDPHA